MVKQFDNALSKRKVSLTTVNDENSCYSQFEHTEGYLHLRERERVESIAQSETRRKYFDDNCITGHGLRNS